MNSKDYRSCQYVFAHMSSDQNSGWLGYIGEYTTQLYRDFSKPL